MACCSQHHKELVNGVGKCSKPMWNGYGGEAGFCDADAYGEQEPGQERAGEYIRGRWVPMYVPFLACYNHGGPKDPQPHG
jgi:hypothetical protein